MRNAPALGNRPAPADAIEWRVSEGLTAYPDALAEMNARVEAVQVGSAPELIWLLEHPPLYTAGTSAVPAELFNPQSFPVYEAGRGGRYTYHGPGQRVGYLVLDLEARGRDIRHFVQALEDWLIGALGRIGVEAFRVDDRIGIWTNAGGREAKLGAIGVRVRRWVTMHGFAINVNPELSHFSGIVPCGIADYPVTSLGQLAVPEAKQAFGMAQFDLALREGFDGFLLALSRG